MAFEIVAERSFAIALESHGIKVSVREAILDVLPDRTYMSSKTRALWSGLTGDGISRAPSWKAYTKSVERRNAAAHAGERYKKGDADASIEADDGILMHTLASRLRPRLGGAAARGAVARRLEGRAFLSVRLSAVVHAGPRVNPATP
jgi:hypothetical protein